MVRKLKFHERKLLKRVDFINWDDKNLKEIAIMKQYCITRPEYTAYNKLAREVRELAEAIMKLPESAFRLKQSAELTDKLFEMGLIKTKRLKKADVVTVKSFCRRRLPVFMAQSGMFDGSVDTAAMYVTHGHVRVGPHIVKDPAFLVTRSQQDFVTWTQSFKKKIQEYNNQVDDYED